VSLVPPIAISTSGGTAHVRFTTRADGDMNADLVDAATLVRRQRGFVDLPWTVLDEVHGTCVVTVTEPGGQRGEIADGAVTRVLDAVLGIWVGDCAPVAFVSAEGVIGAAHAGWRGLTDGVLETTVAAMRSIGASHVRAVLGPCVHRECYEFGAADLDGLVARFGPAARAVTAWGTPALDLPAAIGAVLDRVDVSLVPSHSPCTACDTDYWSHRARGEKGRHAMAVWLERDGWAA
jgi:YfiH family protein